MANISDNNKRIAKNTLLLYGRMAIMMFVGLFTSRVNLASLGIQDYGIYNAVGGVVAMLSILSGAMAVAVSRFITVGLGKGDEERMKVIFSTSVIIQIMMSAIVIFVAEIIGVWFLNTRMVIPADRISAANVVFQCSLITFAINLLSVPYNAVIIAHEKMAAFGYISILEALLKLLVAYLIYVSPFDKLDVYAILLCLVALLIRLIYGVYCKRHFSETIFKFVLDKNLVKEMFGFIGWAFLGNGVVVLKDQGINILLNLFCGPVVNAARGISMQVNNYVYSFVQNFMTAVNPQITKNYAQKDIVYMHKLIIRSAKFGFFIMMILVLPLCANIDYVLNLWLVKVPAHTNNFVTLVLIYSLVGTFSVPLLTGVLAEGNIKNYEINLGITYFSNFIAAYFILDAGVKVEWVFVLNIFFELIVLFILLLQSKRKYSLPIGRYTIECLIPCISVLGLCTFIIYILKLVNANNIFIFIVDTIIIVAICFITVATFGVSRNERQYLIKIIKSKIIKE